MAQHIDRRAPDEIRAVVGYQEPKDKCWNVNYPLTLRRLVDNDPLVSGANVLNDQWMERAGRAIGDNTCLKKLDIDLKYDGMTTRKAPLRLAEFCRDISRNRSIEWLKLSVNRHLEENIYQLLIPFFKSNYNLRSITIYDNSYNSSPIFSSLCAVLSGCQENRLERLHVSLNSISAEEEREFFTLLNSMGTLLDLSYDERTNGIGEAGCLELCTLLMNPQSTLHTLHVRLGNSCGNDCIHTLSAGLTRSASLKLLHLRENSSITANGWGVFFCSVFIYRERFVELERLILVSTEIGNEGATMLGHALTNNKTLKVLHLANISSVTQEGWKQFACRFIDTAVEELFLFNCNLNDLSAASIVCVLEFNNSLKKLDIASNPSIYPAGLAMIFQLLLQRNPPALEELDVTENFRLGRLNRDGWRLLSRVICDKTSIDATYSSHHSFHTLRGLEYRIPKDIASILEMNKNEKDKVELARQKILKCHFTGRRSDVQVFARMPENVLPFAIEWIGRNQLGYSLMHAFVCGFPTLFDIRHGPQPTGAKKRKIL